MVRKKIVIKPKKTCNKKSLRKAIDAMRSTAKLIQEAKDLNDAQYSATHLDTMADLLEGKL